MTKQIVLPELAESVVEGEILEWLVPEGGRVELDQPLLEVASDKVTVELPSPYAGVLIKHLARVGDTVAVNAPIALLREHGEDEEEAEKTPETEPTQSKAEPENAGTEGQDDDGDSRSLFRPDDGENPAPRNPFLKQQSSARRVENGNRHGRVPAVPAARILAQKLGVDIERVTGSGPNGRVRIDDVHEFAGRQRAMPDDADAAATMHLPPPVPYRTPAGYAERERREPLRGVRGAIARQMSASHLYAVRTLAVDEADMTGLRSLRADLKPQAAAEAVRLTYLPFVFKALVRALKKFPNLNTSLDESTREIVHKSYYNLGLAVATEAGLVVPVVRDVDSLSVLETAREINRLAEGARAGELTPDEMHGASFSVTNIGAIGTLFSFPIINVPDAAILGVHAIKERPVALNGAAVVRPMMYLSISFDHRLVDGAEAALFLRNIIDLLEAPDEFSLDAV